MDSLYLSKHLRIEHEKIVAYIEYLNHFVDHPLAITHEKEVLSDNSSFYSNISNALVLAICIKMDKIEMFDPLLLNYHLLVTV